MPIYLGSLATPEQWAAAKLVAEGYLICAAQARRLVTYKELGAAIEAAVGAQMPNSLWGSFLGEVVPEFHARHRVVLSAVLVRSNELTPGAGIYELAGEQGWLRANESEPAAIERFQSRLFQKFGTA